MLLDSDCQVKLADFGLARSVSSALHYLHYFSDHTTSFNIKALYRMLCFVNEWMQIAQLKDDSGQIPVLTDYVATRW